MYNLSIKFSILALLMIRSYAAAQTVDPDFGRQWYLENTGQVVGGVAGVPGADVDVLSAWTMFDGASNVTVAIVSTGVDPHPEFASRLLEGISFVGDPLNTLDVCGTGTHIAGVIGAARGNFTGDNGIAGVCPTVYILPVRVSDSCASGISATAQGIEWAADHGADIIVVSVSFSSGNSQLLQAIDYAASLNVVVVAPAGNIGDNVLAFPANYDDCIAVSATTNRNGLTSFSNFGMGLDLSAPGENIYSAWLGDAYMESSESGATAAALVAGAAALLKSYNPNLTGLQLRQLINDTAVPIGDPMLFGSGRLCTGCALQQASPPLLRFEHDLLQPRIISPNASTTRTVQLVDVSDVADVDRVFLHYQIDDGPWRVTSIRHISGEAYKLRWPAIPCDSTLSYFLSAETVSGDIIFDPVTAPLLNYSVRGGNRVVVFGDDFEADLGWLSLDTTGSDKGLWERVIPIGTSAQPAYDATPQAASFCYVTGQHVPGQSDGFNDVDGGPVELWSPEIPIPSRNVELSFSCWVESLGSGTPDSMVVEVSVDDGQSWLLIDQIPATAGWTSQVYALREVLGFSGPSMRVRFSIADLDASLTEAAVDNFRVTWLPCSTASHDADGNGIVDQEDLSEFITCLGGPSAIIADDACRVFDVYGLSEVDLNDFSAFQRRFNP